LLLQPALFLGRVASASPFSLFAGTTEVEHPKSGFDVGIYLYFDTILKYKKGISTC
jgi:hypothetical protein